MRLDFNKMCSGLEFISAYTRFLLILKKVKLYHIIVSLISIQIFQKTEACIQST